MSRPPIPYGTDPFTPSPRTPGPLGHNDAADPDRPASLKGATPGPLGFNDHADPAHQQLSRSLRQQVQLKHWYQILVAEQEAMQKEAQQHKIDAKLRIPKWILGQVLTNVVYPIIFSYDPVLFVQLLTGRPRIEDFIDLRLSDHLGGIRDKRIEAVHQLIEAAKELKELLGSDMKVWGIWYGLEGISLMSRIVGYVGTALSDPDVAAGLIDSITIYGLKIGSVEVEGLDGENRLLEQRQKTLDEMSALNDREIKRYVQLIHQLNQTVKPRTRVAGTQHLDTSQRRADQSPDAARGLRAELITDPVLPSKLLTLNAPSNPPESLHGSVEQAGGGKCEEIAKRVFELEAKLQDLRKILEELENRRDGLKELQNVCPAWEREKERLTHQKTKLSYGERRTIRRLIDNAKGELADCDQRGEDCSDIQARISSLESELSDFDHRIGDIDDKLEVLDSKLRQCPPIDDLNESLKELEEQIAKVRHDIVETEEKLKAAERELEECLN